MELPRKTTLHGKLVYSLPVVLTAFTGKATYFENELGENDNNKLDEKTRRHLTCFAGYVKEGTSLASRS